jgi:hypothetical protein
LIRLQAYIVDVHEVFGRVGNIQARNKTGHGKIDQKYCLSCTRENKHDKKLVKEKLLVCAGLKYCMNMTQGPMHGATLPRKILNTLNIITVCDMNSQVSR